MVALGSTLASNINLNGGGNVEFGQGISATVACQSDPLTITPYETFNNTRQSFTLSELDFNNISTGCFSTYFKISIWPTSGGAPLIDFGIGTVGGIDVDSPGDSVVVGETSVNDDGTGHIRITKIYNSNFDQSDSNNIPAVRIGKITIESSSTPIALGGELRSAPGQYVVGDQGPAGGIIFYASTNGFNCGPTGTSFCYYLEAAPVTGVNAWTDYPHVYVWSQDTVHQIGTRSELGTGFSNTLAMNSAQANESGYAATVVRAYRGPNNYSDWFLPSLDELHLLYLAGDAVSPGDCGYWSSSEGSPSTSTAYFTFLKSGCYSPRGYTGMNYKVAVGPVRPIRAF